ncbi:MAG: hypothetical protein V1891_00710 [bacterium]
MDNNLKKVTQIILLLLLTLLIIIFYLYLNVFRYITTIHLYYIFLYILFLLSVTPVIFLIFYGIQIFCILLLYLRSLRLEKIAYKYGLNFHRNYKIFQKRFPFFKEINIIDGKVGNHSIKISDFMDSKTLVFRYNFFVKDNFKLRIGKGSFGYTGLMSSKIIDEWIKGIGAGKEFDFKKVQIQNMIFRIISIILVIIVLFFILHFL